MNPAVKQFSIPSNARLLSIASTQKALDCSRASVYRLIDAGLLRRVYIRGMPRIIAADVEGLAEAPEPAEG